jgi:hypothetical protein
VNGMCRYAGIADGAEDRCNRMSGALRIGRRRSNGGERPHPLQRLRYVRQLVGLELPTNG